jgi:hypothetical protein
MIRRVPIPHGDGFVYVIINERTGRRYVGHTQHYVSERWTLHRSALRGNRHANAALQRDWNEYGESAFQVHELVRASGYQFKRLEESWTRRYFETGVPLYNQVAGAKRIDWRTLDALCKAVGVESLGELFEYQTDGEQ